jgi:hypothetical protein
MSNKNTSGLKQNDRGMLLIVAMLIILVLAGLALIGVRNVILESRHVGNFRTSEQALHVTESGQSSIMAVAVEKGDSFPAFIQANNFMLSMTDVADPFFDTKPKGSFGMEYVNLGGGTNVNFVTELTQPVDTNRVPGYPVNDQFIWKKYRITTSGYFGDQKISLVGGKQAVDDTLRNANHQYVSYTFVGPYIIGGGGQ